MVAKDDDGKGVPIPGLILDSEEDIRRFVRSIRRKEQSTARTKRFEPSQFILSEHKEALVNQNAQVTFEK